MRLPPFLFSRTSQEIFSMLDTVTLLAGMLARNVRVRYRPAQADEVPYALDHTEALTRANDFGGGTGSEQYTAAAAVAVTQLTCEQPPTERWVPRIEMLNYDHDDYDDIGLLAEITARKASVGYQPVQYAIANADEMESGMLPSAELASMGVPESFASAEVRTLVLDRAYEILDRWSGCSGLWHSRRSDQRRVAVNGPNVTRPTSTSKE
jgi:hypothetical protein